MTRNSWAISVVAICTALLVQALPCSGETAAGGKRVFMIGNSFTHDSMPYSIPALAAQKKDSLTVGAHIKSGSPVHNIWGSPDTAREVSKDFGKYRDALTKHQWDVVTLQPFYKKPGEGFPQSTMQSDIDAILKFIELTRENPANRKTKFYLYESWPFLWTGKPFQQAWDATTTDELTAPTMHTRDYYEHLLAQLREKTDAEIHVIPVPEVMYQLDRQMQAGKVPGLTGIGDIMKDKLHLNAGLGHSIASVTVYATLFGKNPAGLVKPEGHYDGGNQELLTPQMCEIVNTTVWDVVSKNPSTGVGAAAAASSAVGDIHLAPHGSDQNSGDTAHPVSTLQAAQRLVRHRIRAGLDAPLNVLIHPGVYEIGKPLVLEPQDSGTPQAPIVWRALNPQDRPVLSAGSQIHGQWQPGDKPGVWVIDVPAAKKTADDPGWNFRQLFVDGQRAIRARFPNAIEDNPFVYADERNHGAKDHVAIDPDLIKDAWLGETDAQLNIVVDWLFFNQWNTIAAIDKQAGKIFFTDSERHGRVWENNWFFVEGLFAELDQPGEWYLDRNRGRLYYMPEPGRDPNGMRFVAPRLDRVVHAQGDVEAGTHVAYVHLDGIVFRHTAFNLGHIAPRVHTDSVIRFENTSHSTVTNCLFENIGGYAFWLHLDSQRNTFDHNVVLDAGGGGVLLTGARLSYMDDSKVYTQGEAASKVAPILNEITHNTVKHCGKIRYYGGGVHLDSRPYNMSMLPGNRVANNHFEDLSRNGIFAFRNQGGNVIEYNHIHDAMQTTIDGACIHFATMNHQNAPNSILNNWLYDIWGFRYLPDRRPDRVLANGVFLDWDTSNTTVRDNIVYNAGGEPIKAIWDNWNIALEGNKTSATTIVPSFVDQVGPDGSATNGINLEANRLMGRVIHYTDPAYTKATGAWSPEQRGGQGKLFTYNMLKATPDKPARITYTLPIPEDGTYQLALLYKPDTANATNAHLQVHHANGTDELDWDMTKGNEHGFAVEIGRYRFQHGCQASVVITNEDADGVVIADAVAFVKVDSL